MKKRKKKIYAVVLAVSAVTIIYFGFVLFLPSIIFSIPLLMERIILLFHSTMYRTVFSIPPVIMCWRSAGVTS